MYLKKWETIETTTTAGLTFRIELDPSGQTLIIEWADSETIEALTLDKESLTRLAELFTAAKGISKC